jgi:3,4-dihydroxy-2-butanone 4-phosphate synthase
MMTNKNKAANKTAFTVSIEAAEGITTGISAADRAHTIKTVVDTKSKPSDIVQPGSYFPLKSNGRRSSKQSRAHLKRHVILLSLLVFNLLVSFVKS